MGNMLTVNAMAPALTQTPACDQASAMQPLHHAGNHNFNQWMMDPGMLPAQVPVSFGYAAPQTQATVPTPPLATPSFACTQPGCQAVFKRDADRIRHEASKHGINGMLHFCQIVGCPKSLGAGYTRKDKLTEHMWK